MRAGEDTAAHRVDEEGGERLLGGEVDDGRLPAEVPVQRVRPLATVELVAGLAEEQDDLPFARKPEATDVATSSMTPSTPTTGVGWTAVSPVWL